MKLVLDGRYQTKPALRILMEKSKGLCRQLVLPSVPDAIVLQRLSDAVYSSIKQKSPTNRSFFEQDDHRFSQSARDENGAPRYGGLRAWLNFQKALFEFSANKKYIISTDIANYYDCISYAHLRNVIANYVEVKESVLDLLIFVLAGLLWQPDYMPRIEIGLPQIDFDAPRVLAHCLLYELDAHLKSVVRNDFVRYMDDIDVGTDDLYCARRILRDMDLVLHTRQLRLNSGKTRIMSGTEAEEHFRVRDNHRLNLVQRWLRMRSSKKRSIDRGKLYVRMFLRKRYVHNKFDEGNGEKILKRVLHTAAQYPIDIDRLIVSDIIFNRPSCREPALKYVFSMPVERWQIRLLENYITSGVIVDDVGYLAPSKGLAEARVVKDLYVESSICRIVEHLKSTPNFGLLSAIWIASRFFQPKQLIELLIDTKSTWRGDYSIGRMIGGLRPIFTSCPEQEVFDDLSLQVRNEALEDTKKFHVRLSTEPAMLNAVRKFIVAPNKSKPLEITHAKFLMLLSLLQNPGVNVQEAKVILGNFCVAASDPFYRATFGYALPTRLSILLR